jgi:hypothetical protein
MTPGQQFAHHRSTVPPFHPPALPARFLTFSLPTSHLEATMGDKQSDRHIDEHILDRDKQELQSNPHAQPMIPTAGTNPAAREIQERKAAGKQSRDDSHMAGRKASDSADDKLDEALQESFPASDPPAQP